ncbi:MAG: YggS family pyridoxal phosphate-dependent enzyme [Peptococcaceae bacterium]|jgi:pyridoxal phosphate enzyme (YggS family)|nr:YggS family pyridoxal phosphate-dependent enzyme [Peptococcaceae bacterium]
MTVAENLARVRERIAAAARRAGRDPSLVRLVAVTKGVDADGVQSCLAAGVHSCGENRVQEWLAKRSLLPAGVEWHLIGTVQLNKVKYLDDTACLIHSLDRLELARALDGRFRKLGREVRVLVQVNVSGEKSKHGLSPSEVEPFLREVAPLTAVKVEGLMTMAPAGPGTAARQVFRALRELSCRIPEMATLSMGMSDDFEVAVEEGANLVRIGRAIFAPGSS